jgi:hypothetical protein
LDLVAAVVVEAGAVEEGVAEVVAAVERVVEVDHHPLVLDIIVHVLVQTSFVQLDRYGVVLEMLFFQYLIGIIIVLVPRLIVTPHQLPVQ